MDQERGLLGPCRVLDLADERGILCGKVLGELGADVIKIERPGGDPARLIGPFLNREVHPEKSLFWLAYATNKRSITLDIETEDGRRLFEGLVKTADIVIESFDPGYLNGLKLGYQELSQVKPAVILVSITPFGQVGPYSHYKASDLTVAAMSGYMYLCGDSAQPPVRISFPQAYLHGSAAALAGALMALYWQRQTGEGQHVDVSAQESYHWPTEMAPINWDLSQIITRRVGNATVNPPAPPRQRGFRCADSWVSMQIRTGRGGAASQRALVEWMEEEGLASDFMKNIEWEKFSIMGATPEEIIALDRVAEEMGQFFSRFTKQRIYEEAIKRDIILQPVCTMKDIAEDAQLKARGFWMKIDYPELQTSLTYPGFCCKASVPLKKRNRAPRIGEHNDDIYMGELGLSSEELALLRRRGII